MTARREALRLANVGLGLALAVGLAAPSPTAAQAPARSTRAPTIYNKSRSFKIPFNVDPSERSRLKEVQLWVSGDAGFTWKPQDRTTPDRPSFAFKATRDGEYWFAVRTLDTQGRLFPKEDTQVEPSMKVIVDTVPPSLILEPDRRSGSLATVRWEVRDEHLALGSLVLEYQAEGAREWRRVPISRPRLIGSETWDAGTAEPLKVRASISDQANNTTEETVLLPDGIPTNPGFAAGDGGPITAPPPVSQISAGPSFPAVDDSQAPDPPDRFAPRRPSSRGQAGPENEPDPFSGGGPDSPSPAGSAAAKSRRLLVGTAHFPLYYAVDDAGPDGPHSVELWVTQDGGRTWSLQGEDPDRNSPFPVNLGGEGTFGLCLVARSASGLGDQPPAPGDAPQTWVEVDTSPPKVELFPAVVGSGKNVGKVAITWTASDFHLGPRPVTLLWRPDQPGAPWQKIVEGLENKGKYIWNVPRDVPARIHLRIEVADTVGNRGSAETTDADPVIVDRTRPRSRIIGLEEPGSRTSAGGTGRPVR